MVAPTTVSDNYVSVVVDLGMDDMAAQTHDRFDISHNAGAKIVAPVSTASVTVEFHKKMDSVDIMDGGMEETETMNRLLPQPQFGGALAGAPYLFAGPS